MICQAVKMAGYEIAKNYLEKLIESELSITFFGQTYEGKNAQSMLDIIMRKLNIHGNIDEILAEVLETKVSANNMDLDYFYHATEIENLYEKLLKLKNEKSHDNHEMTKQCSSFGFTIKQSKNGFIITHVDEEGFASKFNYKPGDFLNHIRMGKPHSKSDEEILQKCVKEAKTIVLNHDVKNKYQNCDGLGCILKKCERFKKSYILVKQVEEGSFVAKCGIKAGQKIKTGFELPSEFVTTTMLKGADSILLKYY